MQDLEPVRTKYLAGIAAAGDEAAIEVLRVTALGKKGEISLMMRGLGKMTPDERQQAGPRLNALKDEINTAITARKAGCAGAESVGELVWRGMDGVGVGIWIGFVSPRSKLASVGPDLHVMCP